ncbi:MAG: hypothetical protein WBO45_14400 [Planctomycetota bacterium]
MHPTWFGSFALFLLSSVPLRAQVGNETIFIGTSTSGSTDNHSFVASGAGAILSAGPSSFTDNVTDAVWADAGRNLYCGQSLQNRVSRAAWDGSTPTWSTFYAAPGACYGIGYDVTRRRLWVLTGASTASRQLHCLDADPNSVTYGSYVTQTVMAGASRERWALSPSGNLAAVPHVFLQGGLFELVDLDPASPTYLQTIVSTPIPGASAGLSFAAACQISMDDLYVYVLYAGLGTGGLAVYERPTASWLDFGAAAGQQDLAMPMAVPNSLALSPDRSFALVAGSGTVARIDFDYATPANTATTVFAGLTVPNVNGLSLSPDGLRGCVTSTPASVSPPGTLVVFDAFTGATLQSVALGNMWNIYTTAWQDASPTATYVPFGVGCSGTLGAPTLAAQAGSRPALGSTFTAVAGGLPLNLAVLQLGLSNTLMGGTVPLPFPLAAIGMPGCFLLVDPVVSLVLSGAGNSATWSWPVPGTPSLFGAQFFSQAFPLDPPANSLGFSASNGAVGTLGF